MIIKMKKASIICLAKYREDALTQLQELGVLHVELEKVAETGERAAQQVLLAEADRALNALSIRKSAGKGAALSGKDALEKTIAVLDEQAKLKKQQEKLVRDQGNLLPWGDFSAETIEQLKERGIMVYLCAGSAEELEAIKALEGVVCKVIRENKGNCHFAVVAQTELDEDKLPLAQVPENRSLSEVELEINRLNKRLGALDAELDQLALATKNVQERRAEIASAVEFLHNRDGMGGHGELAYINGFVPVPEIDELKAAAAENGWALLLTEPAGDDPVPTLIKIPKIFRLIKPMFDFLGISPGYDELDVSVSVLFFFMIFFGMIVGDAGYGSIFLVAAIICRIKFPQPKFRLPIRLFMLLSAATVTWGALSGNWFGCPVGGIKWLTDTETKNSNVQLFCFILAVAQLTLGHLWRAILTINSRRSLGQIGWALILWGNFFLTTRLLVYPGEFPVYMYWLYGTGIGLVILFDVNWKDPGEAFNFPFSVVGSFVDMLSYIRLFAVGIAGFYIANSFNSMGMSLWRLSPWLIAVGILVIVAGHLLNMVLCLMSVLVHGVRLNVLEFSNHIGLRWAGHEYKPFKKHKSERRED